MSSKRQSASSLYYSGLDAVNTGGWFPYHYSKRSASFKAGLTHYAYRGFCSMDFVVGSVRVDEGRVDKFAGRIVRPKLIE